MFEIGDRVKIVRRTDEIMPVNFIGQKGIVIKIGILQYPIFVELESGKVNSFWLEELESESIIQCPVCNDPLGINKDGKVLPCAGCNEDNY